MVRITWRNYGEELKSGVRIIIHFNGHPDCIHGRIIDGKFATIIRTEEPTYFRPIVARLDEKYKVGYGYDFYSDVVTLNPDEVEIVS